MSKETVSEYKWVLIGAVLIVALTCVPYLFGILITPPGYHFIGLTQNIDDGAVYLSWMRQAADGHLFARNLFTNASQSGLQFNVLFLMMGTFARLSHLSCVVVYHLFRVLFGVGLFIAVHRFSLLFLSERRERLFVMALVGLTSGIGWLIPNVQSPVGSVDVWQPEAITLLSIYLNPMFLASLMLMLGALYYLVLAERTGRARYALLAGVCVLLLGNIHSYDVLTVAGVWAAYLLARGLVGRVLPTRTLGLSVLAAVVGIPSILYQAYVYLNDGVFRARANTVIASPPVTSFFTGYGVVLLAAIVGGVILLALSRGTDAEPKQGKHPHLLLLVWSVVGFAVPYIPIAQQRKLIMGLHIPLCMLAAVALGYAWRRLRPTYAICAICAFFVLAVPSNVNFLGLDMALLTRARTVTRYVPYISTNQLRAIDYIKENADDRQATFCSPQAALLLPAYGGKPVYYGHWSETPDYNRKLAHWVGFTDPALPPEAKRALLADTRCDFVITDSTDQERLIGDTARIGLVKVAMFGDSSVYRVTR